MSQMLYKFLSGYEPRMLQTSISKSEYLDDFSRHLTAQS